MIIKGLRLFILGQPNPNELKDIYLVGRYAFGVIWGDDYSSIYLFDRLRVDDPAGGHESSAALMEAMGWPRDIKKLTEGLCVTWTDGHESFYPYVDLCVLCRCAGCIGGY